jgi:hypothetical protein
MRQEDKVLENKLRRMASRRGWRLEKSRRRDPNALDYGGYMLVDAYRNIVLYGAHQHQYELSLQDVQAILTDAK